MNRLLIFESQTIVICKMKEKKNPNCSSHTKTFCLPILLCNISLFIFFYGDEDLNQDAISMEFNACHMNVVHFEDFLYYSFSLSRNIVTCIPICFLYYCIFAVMVIRLAMVFLCCL